MSNLIPTPIVDKNGKQTTVHKKQSTAAQGSKRIPAPTVKKPSKVELAQQAAHQFAMEYVESQGPNINRDAAYNMIFNDTFPALKKCSIETINKVQGADITAHRRFTLASGFGDGWREEMVNDYINVAPILESNDFTYKESKNFLIALEHYGDLEPMKRGKYPEERASQTAAVVRTTAHLYSNPHNVPAIAVIDMWADFEIGNEWESVPYIKDEKLRELILHSEYDRESIVDIIVERSIIDPDQIIDMINIGDTTALRNGAL